MSRSFPQNFSDYYRLTSGLQENDYRSHRQLLRAKGLRSQSRELNHVPTRTKSRIRRELSHVNAHPKRRGLFRIKVSNSQGFPHWGVRPVAAALQAGLAAGSRETD
ncbi:hypothetical protein SBA2_200015 [Acidobacteriia bacterium SbA2]|nr:hypothetical protein SBA2_200015 [Acidobacteriia bacterium SbA2]